MNEDQFKIGKNLHQRSDHKYMLTILAADRLERSLKKIFIHK